MRHRKKVQKLGLKKNHRVSLLRNLTGSLVLHGKIKTTENRAKALAGKIGKLLQMLRKKEGRDFIRKLPSIMKGASTDPKELTKIMENLKSKHATRITKLGFRKGDNASLVLIELI